MRGEREKSKGEPCGADVQDFVFLFFFPLSRREMALEGKREIFGDIYFWAGSWRDGEGG